MPFSLLRLRVARRALVAICVALAFPLASCRLIRSPNIEADDSDLVTLSVINHNTQDLVVYNIRQGRRERIGDVTASMTTTFRLHLSRYAGSEIQLRAVPIGGSTSATTDVLHLSPSQIVEWTLESSLTRSFVAVRY